MSLISALREAVNPENTRVYHACEAAFRAEKAAEGRMKADFGRWSARI
jgi:hypothetical protein